MADYQFITYEVKAGAVYLTINRPPLNWLDIATMREVNDALDQVLASGSELKLLVIQAAGEKAFSVGVDVADHTEDRVASMIEVFHGIFRRLDRLEIPSLAVARGAVLGGGCEVVLFAIWFWRQIILKSVSRRLLWRFFHLLPPPLCRPLSAPKWRMK